MKQLKLKHILITAGILVPVLTGLSIRSALNAKEFANQVSTQIKLTQLSASKFDFSALKASSPSVKSTDGKDFLIASGLYVNTTDTPLSKEQWIQNNLPDNAYRPTRETPRYSSQTQKVARYNMLNLIYQNPQALKPGICLIGCWVKFGNGALYFSSNGLGKFVVTDVR